MHKFILDKAESLGMSESSIPDDLECCAFKETVVSQEYTPKNDGMNTTWYVNCKVDPRFNMHGRCLGVFNANAEMDKAIRNKCVELGIDPEKAPDDIEICAYKD